MKSAQESVKVKEKEEIGDGYVINTAFKSSKKSEKLMFLTTCKNYTVSLRYTYCKNTKIYFLFKAKWFCCICERAALHGKKFRGDPTTLLSTTVYRQMLKTAMAIHSYTLKKVFLAQCTSLHEF